MSDSKYCANDERSTVTKITISARTIKYLNIFFQQSHRGGVSQYTHTLRHRARRGKRLVLCLHIPKFIA